MTTKHIVLTVLLTKIIVALKVFALLQDIFIQFRTILSTFLRHFVCVDTVKELGLIFAIGHTTDLF